MDLKEANELTQKYLDGKCSPEERALFESWYNQAVREQPGIGYEPDYDRLYKNLSGVLPAGKVRKTVLRPRFIPVAAAVTLVLLGVWFFNSRYGDGNVKPQTAAYANDLAPGKQGATLTLGNGKRITLNEAKNGVVVGKDLEYNDGTKVAEEELGSAVVEVTAETARGQTYSFTLPDGTKVWLNADSKISFPSQFKEGQRRIMLEGEAYFEVVKDQVHPFVVGTSLSGKRGGQEVEVLGTHFNINSYADEATIRTTLIEGSVKVSLDGGRSSVLKPGQQAALRGQTIEVDDVDPNLFVAWKNNKFIFENDDVQYIMRQIERWYNVEVVYKSMPTERFGGKISRFDNISKVLNILESAGGVHFKLDGRKLYVYK